MNKILSLFPALALLVLSIVIWEIVVRVGNINERILPAPSTIENALFLHWPDLFLHALQTLTETVLGLFFAVILGVLIAVGVDRFAWSKKAIYPLLVTSQTIPLIALAPLLLLWFGFDLLPKVIMVTLYCFFPIAISTADGLANTSSELLILMKSMGAKRIQIYTLVKIPQALPSFFSGLKIAVTYSVAGAIVGEYVGAYKGLGIYMQTMSHSYATVLVFAAIVITTVMSLLLFGFVLLIEHVFLSWREK